MTEAVKKYLGRIWFNISNEDQIHIARRRTCKRDKTKWDKIWDNKVQGFQAHICDDLNNAIRLKWWLRTFQLDCTSYRWDKHLKSSSGLFHSRLTSGDEPTASGWHLWPPPEEIQIKTWFDSSWADNRRAAIKSVKLVDLIEWLAT